LGGRQAEMRVTQKKGWVVASSWRKADRRKTGIGKGNPLLRPLKVGKTLTRENLQVQEQTGSKQLGGLGSFKRQGEGHLGGKEKKGVLIGEGKSVSRIVQMKRRGYRGARKGH